MLLTRYPEAIGGLILSAVGVAVAIYSYFSYDMGTLRLVGPGLFPVYLGIITSILGILLFISGATKSDLATTPDMRGFVIILASLASFIFVAQAFGMVPGVVALIAVSIQAVRKVGWIGFLLLSTLMAAVAVGVFGFVFSLQLPFFRWPF